MTKNREQLAESRMLHREGQLRQVLGEGVDGERIDELPGEISMVDRRLDVIEGRMRAVEGRLSCLEERVDLLATRRRANKEGIRASR